MGFAPWDVGALAALAARFTNAIGGTCRKLAGSLQVVGVLDLQQGGASLAEGVPAAQLAL
jgi:hypothetical protein